MEAGTPETPRDCFTPQMSDGLPGLFWTTDVQLRITNLQIMGGHPGENPICGVIGAPVDSVMESGGFLLSVAEAHRRALRNEIIPLEFMLHSGRWSGWLAPRRDDSGAVVGCVGRALPAPPEQSDPRFQLAFSESPLGMCIVDPQGRCLQANHVLCAMLGCSNDDVQGESLLEFVRADVQRGARAFCRMLRGEVPSCTWQSRYLRDDGQVIWARITAAAVRDSAGQVLLGLGMVEDITAQRRAEEALRRAERVHSIGTLAAGIAHEINNPIGAIDLSAAAALRALGQSQQQDIVAEALHNIQDSAQRCGRIVRSILQFARNPQGEQRPADLLPTIRRAADAVGGLAQRRGVILDIRAAADLPRLVMNATEIEHALANLLANAVQASSAGSRVELRAELSSEEVRIHVKDWGRGMTAEQLECVFDPFYTTREHDGGTGLGLSLAWTMVKNHGGRIDARSAPGRGTTMTVVLPRRGAPRRGAS